MSQRDINKIRDVGFYGERMAEMHFLEHGFNVAWPVVTDGTDFIAYDHGQTWQIQVKTMVGGQKRIDLRQRNRRTLKYAATPYQYIDAFIGIDMHDSSIHVIPAWIPMPGQLTLNGMPVTTASVLRMPKLNCFLDAHSCDTTCDKCHPHLQALSATDRDGIVALMSRSIWAAKYRGKRKGRRGQ